jgi:PAS domain S-box-containing protein
MSALGRIDTLSIEDIPLPAVIGSFRVMRECNQAFADLFGYEKSQLIGKSFRMIYIDNDEYIRRGKIWKRNLEKNLLYVDERNMVKSSGENFWCRVHGQTLNRTNPTSRALWLLQAVSRPVAAAGLALTARQRQIVAFVAQGKSNSDIAREVGISVRTAETHRSRIMKRIGVRNAAELAAWFAGSNEPGLPHLVR